MQYCPSCMIRIRGKKARCPLCQRELMDADHAVSARGEKKAGAVGEGKLQDAAAVRKGVPASVREGFPDTASAEDIPGRESVSGASTELSDDDPFVQLPSPRVSFMLMVRTVTFVCISLEILLGAAQIISGSSGWIFGAMLFVLLGWADFLVAVYYRNNLIRMLTTQAYIIMAACLLTAHVTGTGSWAVTWVVPLMFCLLIVATFAAAKAQGMELHEFILYPAFDFLMSLFQIIPIALGKNPFIAPAVISIAQMLILVNSLVIFRGRMLREAAAKYLHI